MSKHRIVSYNILSSHLCEPEYFTSCKPENLKPENRLPKIMAKLKLEIEQNAIICLQEVSTLWAGQLHRFFAENNYYFVTGLYGKAHNGYMGVGIAWSMAQYQVLDVEIERLSDSYDWSKLTTTRIKLQNWFQDLVTKIGLDGRKLEHPLRYAKSRLNQLIFLRLQDKTTQERFTITNYHMPCAFFAPQVMTMHVMMLIQRMQALAGVDPMILVGDFNIRPVQPQYRLITTGLMEQNDPAYPCSILGQNCQVKLDVLLKSAYQEALGNEPKFTNYAQTKKRPVFQETLDYIWLSPQWKVISVLPLPQPDEIVGPLPNDQEPSDHLLIASDVQLTN